jgi:YgiT-type zinc finger domain-containing protein
MKCVICHSDDIREKVVMEEFKSDSDIVYLPVTAQECAHCGERYYSRHTMRMIEHMEKKIMRKDVRLKQVGKVLVAEEQEGVYTTPEG